MVDCRYVNIIIQYLVSCYVLAKTNIFYVLPLIPVLSRTALSLKFKNQMNELLLEPELDREAHRTLIIPLAGFSFTGLMGIMVVDLTLR